MINLYPVPTQHDREFLNAYLIVKLFKECHDTNLVLFPRFAGGAQVTSCHHQRKYQLPFQDKKEKNIIKDRTIINPQTNLCLGTSQPNSPLLMIFEN